MTDDEFSTACDGAIEKLTSLTRIDGASVCVSDQTLGIDMHGEQVAEFLDMLKRWGKPDGIHKHERKDRRGAGATELELALAFKAVTLQDRIGDLTADLADVAAEEHRDISEVVRQFLTCRHAKYPGVTADIEACLDRMAILSGWIPPTG